MGKYEIHNVSVLDFIAVFFKKTGKVNWNKRKSFLKIDF